MPDFEPGVRRMCIAVAGRSGLLASACQYGGFDRVFVFPAPGGGAQTAVAPPGIDEVTFAADLVGALRAGVATDPGPDPAVLALDVGIVRVHEDGFAGSAIDRVLRLVRGDVLRDLASAGRPGLLAAITEPLFTDLLGEGWPTDGWRSQPPAGIWCKGF
jgi:hypothetical protein